MTSAAYTLLVGLALAPLVLATPAVAQDTRAAEIGSEQEAKAAHLAPYRPTRFETILTRLERNFADPPSGFFPATGRVYAGGGFSFGGGYRRFFARRAVWDATALYSIRNYKLIEIGARTPWNRDGRLALNATAGWIDAPAVGFFGIGADQNFRGRANYHLSQMYVSGAAAFRPTSWSRLVGEVGVDDYSTRAGKGGRPSIETIYEPSRVPGLLARPAYLRAQATAAIDWRPAEGYARKGGYYGATFVTNTDRDDTFSFKRLDGEVIQHLPLLRETWVVSFRGRVQSTLGDDDVVPYFLLPQLGSGRTLRAYSTGRWRDRHALLTNTEFRWIPNRLGLDMALFYDAGKVASRWSALEAGDWKSDWGIGARFHGPTSTVLRVEAARGTEGWNLVFSTSAPF